MARTVAHVLSNAQDSVALINDINTNGGNSVYISNEVNQDEINALVQRNVNHLELILAFDGTNDTPNVVGSSNSKKTDCSNAVTTGKAYISANS